LWESCHKVVWSTTVTKEVTFVIITIRQHEFLLMQLHKLLPAIFLNLGYILFEKVSSLKLRHSIWLSRSEKL
jgi:hypothetical protein